MNIITVDEILKQIADKHNAKFARYNTDMKEFELSNDNENWWSEKDTSFTDLITIAYEIHK